MAAGWKRVMVTVLHPALGLVWVHCSLTIGMWLPLGCIACLAKPSALCRAGPEKSYSLSICILNGNSTPETSLPKENIAVNKAKHFLLDLTFQEQKKKDAYKLCQIISAGKKSKLWWDNGMLGDHVISRVSGGPPWRSHIWTLTWMKGLGSVNIWRREYQREGAASTEVMRLQSAWNKYLVNTWMAG